MTEGKAMSVQQMVRGRGLRLMLGSVLLAAAALTLAPAQAQGHGSAQGGPAVASMMMLRGSSEQVARRVDRMLDGLNATDAQRSQIKLIAEAAGADLRGQGEAARTLRERGMQIFLAPSVDAAAAESVRQQTLARYDEASRRVLQAMLDVSRVLTPEQRAVIGERMQLQRAQMQERLQRGKARP